MATSGSVSIAATSHDTLKFSWWRNSYSIPNNTTTIGWKLELIADGYGYISSSASKDWSVTVNGVNYSGTNTIGISNNSTKTLASGTTTIAHNDNGTKTFNFSFSQELAITFSGSYIGTKSGSGSGTLDTIPRYAFINRCDVEKYDETSVKITWGADVNCDEIAYSVNGGGWTAPSGSTYPSFRITGLSPNTTYNFRIRVRRTDSKLYTQSDLYQQTTYNYPHCTSSPNFTIGSNLTLDFYNPLGRSITVKGYAKSNGAEIFGGSTTGTRLVGFNDKGSVERQYASIPNSKSGQYKVVVTYGSVSKTRDNGNTYQIKGTEMPTVNGITYRDTADDVVKITDNPQHIVQNQSLLQITYEAATPNYSAGGIAKYTFELNGVTKEKTANGGTVDFGKVDSANDVTLTLTVTDSRGLTAQKSIDITVLAQGEPTATVTLQRLNNYEDESYLTVDAAVSSVDGKNTMKIEYRYKLSTDDYSPFVTIPNKEKQILTLDKNNIFVFNVVVTDAFGSKFDKEFILYKGVFPLFIDTEKNAVGINEFPTDDEALRVAEGIAHFEDGVKISGEMVSDYPIEEGTSGIWTYRKWHSGKVDMECIAFNESSDINELVEIVMTLPFAVSNIKAFVTCLASGWALSKPPYINTYGGDNVTELKMYYTAENSTLRTYYFAVQVKGTWR